MAFAPASRCTRKGRKTICPTNPGVERCDQTLGTIGVVEDQNSGGIGDGLGGISRSLGVIGAIAGSLKTNEASTTLIMIDNRSGVQLAAAEGSAKNTDFNVFGSAFGWAGGAGAGGYSNTPEGKIIIAAFADSYNQLVQAVRNYKAQTVRGGLGTGGTLGVQGGSTPASKEVDAAQKPAAPRTALPKPAPRPAPKPQ